MTEAWFEILKDPSRRATRRKPSQKEQQQRAAARRKQKKAKASRDAAKVRDYKARNTQRDFDVPDVGKKNLFGRMKDYFGGKRNQRQVDAARQQYLDAQEQAKQNQSEMENWKQQIRRDDRAEYESQLPAVQDQAIRDADETETQRLEQTDERLAAGKARRQAAAGSAVLQNIKPVQDANIQRQNKINEEQLAERQAYLEEIKRMREEKAKQMDAENRATTEATSVPLPEIPQNVPLPKPPTARKIPLPQDKSISMPLPQGLNKPVVRFPERLKQPVVASDKQRAFRNVNQQQQQQQQPPTPPPRITPEYERRQASKERVEQRKNKMRQASAEKLNIPKATPSATPRIDPRTAYAARQAAQNINVPTGSTPQPLNPKRANWQKVLQNKSGQVPIQ